MASKSVSTLNSDVSSRHCSCDQNNLHLHVEIENLKQRLLERERHIVKMETNFLREAEKFPNGEFAALTEELLTWQDKYSRLFEAHKRVQKVNQGLEDKLLKMVDRGETEKNNLQEDVAVLTKKLIEQQTIISKLHEENERYRNDLNIAIQLLQCKPSNFIPQRFDMLPLELQAKVRSYIASKQKKCIDGASNNQKPDIKTIKVPIPTFPPTAMVYSLSADKDQRNVNGSDNSIGIGGNNNSSNGCNSNFSEKISNDVNMPVDIVSAAIMAKVLKEREKERSNKKHCQTCSCALILYENKSCQTEETSFSELNSTNLDHVTIDTFNNNLNLLDELENKVAHGGECPDLNEKDGKFSHMSTATEYVKTASQDLIDLNGYNSDDNYEYFRNLNLRVRPKVAEENGNDCKDLISFDSSTASENIRPGPRLCSVRLQPGSNNILLDNAAHFSSPVLYRRRANASDLSEPEPIVHLSKTRRPSVSSSSSDCSGERKVLTETEI